MLLVVLLEVIALVSSVTNDSNVWHASTHSPKFICICDGVARNTASLIYCIPKPSHRPQI